MNTSYEKIYDRFLSKTESHDIIKLIIEDETSVENQEFLEGMFLRLLKGALPKFIYTTSDLKDRSDENATFNYKLSEYEEEIIANFMVVEYLSTKIVRDEFTEATLGSRDFREFSPANLLNSLRELRDTFENEAIDLMNVNYYFQSYGGL